MPSPHLEEVLIRVEVLGFCALTSTLIGVSVICRPPPTPYPPPQQGSRYIVLLPHLKEVPVVGVVVEILRPLRLLLFAGL